jgi:hypothetical protein
VTRRLRFGIVGAAVLAAMSAGPVSAQRLPEGVAECLSRMAIQLEQDLDERRGANEPRAGETCPDVAEAIDSGAWGRALVGAGARDLTATSLAALASLAASYERPGNAGVDLATAGLDEALKELELRESPENLSIWERVQKWFDEHFGTQGDEARSRLERWLEGLSVPERAVRFLVIALGFLIVAATAVIVWNELRVAGVLAGGVLRKYAPLTRESASAEVPPRRLEDVLHAPLGRRPALLLALVLDRLRASSKAPLRDSLTHRELLGVAHGLSAEQSDAFRLVVEAAERTTFGGWQPDAPACDGLVERGRSLLESLPDEATAR